MKLEEQIKKLSELGIVLNDGIGVNELLLSWSREEYEQTPFDLILFAYGGEVEAEPFGRYFCDRVWNFDAECFVEDGDYVAVVKQFHRITGEVNVLTDISDRVDGETEQANLQYTIDGVRRNFDIKMQDDWFDAKTAETVLNDFRERGVIFMAWIMGKPQCGSIWTLKMP